MRREASALEDMEELSELVVYVFIADDVCQHLHVVYLAVLRKRLSLGALLAETLGVTPLQSFAAPLSAIERPLIILGSASPL